MTTVPGQPAPPANIVLVIAIVAIAFFMENLDATVIVTALPAMARSMQTTPVALSLGMTAYLVTVAICVPASGWLADRFGARTVFCTAIGVFTVASVLCAVSQNPTQFVAARIVQALGGAMMGPVGRLVVLRTTPKEQLVRAINWMTAPSLIGPFIGPPVGGFITTYFGWRWIFFINVPIGIIGVALALKVLANHRAEHRRPFDTLGLLLSGAAMAGLLLGMELMGQGRWAPAAALVAVAVASGAAGVRHALTTEHPLVDLRSLSVATYRMTALGAGFVVRLCLGWPTLLTPLLLQVGLGKTAFVSGLVVLAAAAGDMLTKSITTRTVAWLGFRSLLLWSAGGFGVSIALNAAFSHATPYWLIVAVLFISGSLRSLQMTGVSALQFADIPADQMTAASTLQAMFQQAARALGVAAAALTVNLFAMARGAHTPALADFQGAMLVGGVIILSTLLSYRRLPRDVALHVSGHQPRRPRPAGA